MKKILNYLKSIISEAKKISWPTRKQVINYVGVVIFISFFVGLFLGMIDWIVLNLFQKLIF